MIIKQKRIIRNGKTWKSEFEGETIFTPFPVTTYGQEGICASEMVDLYEVQEREVDIGEAGFIKEDSLPTECDIISEFKKVGEFAK